MKVEAVVFDLDQTLFDHEGSAQAGLTTWMSSLGHTPDGTLLDAWFAAEERHMAAWRIGECSWEEQRRRRLRDILPMLGRPVGSDDELDAIFQGYLCAYEAAWAPFTDAAECILRLQGDGYRLALLTNGAEAQQRAKLAAIHLADCFELVLTTESLGFGKPDPRAYHAVCNGLDLSPSACVYVGDNYELDVKGPRSIDMHAIHLDRAADTDAIPHRIRSLRRLPEALQALAPH